MREIDALMKSYPMPGLAREHFSIPITGVTDDGPERQSPRAGCESANSLSSNSNGLTPLMFTIQSQDDRGTRICSSVLLPLPLDPTIANDSPADSSRETSRSTVSASGKRKRIWPDLRPQDDVQFWIRSSA